MHDSENDTSQTVADALSDNIRIFTGEDTHVVSWLAVVDVLFPNGDRDLATITSDIPEWQANAMLAHLCDSELVPAPVAISDEDDEDE